MALTDDNSMVMPVTPMYGGNNGMGNFGGDWGWIILLLLIAGNGWGNGFGGFGGGVGGFAADGAMLYPWMNQADITTSGFQNQLLNDNVTSIRDGVFGLSTQLCNCCADTNAAITGAQNALSAQMYGNTIADLERSFASQTAVTGGLNNISAQLAQCCCDNRAATQDVKYTIATEACATRANSTANTQAILDKLCQLELDNYKAQIEAKNDTIAQLRSDVLYARGQASQDVQTARILAGQTAEVDALYNRLNNCPVGTVPVYGRQPIFTCNNGCGCGGVA